MKQLLLIIDAQQELIDGNEHEQAVFKKDELLHTINQVIAQAQAAQVPIAFVRDVDVARGEGKGFQIHAAIHKPVDAPIFDKAATNVFHDTELLPYLKRLGTEHLILMGCKTEHCMDSAVRTATINGFDVTLVADGHSTNGSAVLEAERVITHHNHILDGHYNVEHFALVRLSTENIFEPTHDSFR